MQFEGDQRRQQRRDISVTAKGYNPHKQPINPYLQRPLCVKGTGRGTGRYPYAHSVAVGADWRSSEGGLMLLPLGIWGSEILMQFR